MTNARSDGPHTTGPATGKRNARTALALTCVFAGMVGLSFAAVPLYRLFCQVTGFGGTTQVAEVAPSAVDQTMKVRFNADRSPDLPWAFSPKQIEVEVKLGARAMAYYQAENLSDRPITGTATFNVTPLKAGKYFSKIACFCFTKQTLQPGERVDMPVDYFVDPAILDDPNLADVKTITLSYTFFPIPDEQAAREREDSLVAGLTVPTHAVGTAN
ncbi:cytochrome c oxidase assembly protein [Rhodovibrio salinarum]|uniref:Cytochrome c oxidase assembly protein CtaG n=1 Tax=Rhodovibrio salinarum TaxID=1087 RepID=A0A934UZG8_9PROT|nr:cytochrome c oxidase assembly protein [Rhodovibrio salinarum]MBK1696718.1 cytochrome c oxidase assembly protein [Rhodovibrio salinarum]